MVVFLESVASLFSFVVKVDIDGSRAWSSVAWKPGVSVYELLGLVELVQVFFEEANVLAIGFDCCIGKVTDEGNETNEEVEGNIEQHHNEDAGW